MRNLDLRKLIGMFVLIGLMLVSFGNMNAQVTVNENFETWTPLQTTTSCTTGTLGAQANGWTQDQTDGGEWRADVGGTSSSNTGPSVDYNPGTSSGVYMYTESSSPCYNITCNLESPPVDMTTYNYQLDFAYHMYGVTMGSLSVDVWDGSAWTTGVWTMTGDQGNMWHTASINLAMYSGTTAKIRFSGTTGTSYTSDMAIDDITLFPLLDDDIAVVGIYPTEICSGPTDLFAVVQNAGGNTIYNYLLDWSLDGVAQTQITVTDSVEGGINDTIFLGNINFVNSMYDIVIWASSPNGVVDPNNLNDTLSLLPFFLSLNGNYTIGATGNFVDFTAAVAALNSVGVCGPVVFSVEAGTYTEQVTLGEIAGVSDVNTITFKSASGVNTDVVLTNAASGSSDNWVVGLDGADYVSFEDMTIKSTNGSYSRVVVLNNGAHHNSFIGNILEAPVAGSSSNQMAVVYNWSGAGDSVNVFTNNDILNGSYGMYMYGGSSSSYERGNIISHNNIVGFYYYGLYMRYQYGIKVEYNTIHDASLYSYAYGVYTYYVHGPFTFIGNDIHTSASSTNYGLRLYYCNGYPSMGLVANNFISQSNGSGTAYGLYVYYTSNVSIYNNSVNITAGSASGGHGLYMYCSSSGGYGNIDLVNNSIVNTGGGVAVEIHDNAMSNNMLDYHDYNNYYSTSSQTVMFGSWNASAPADLALIEPHSIMVDPGYASDIDLHSYSALMNNTGKPTSLVPFDIDMDARDPLTPDIGADEYTLFNNDAGITAIIGLDAICPGTIDVYADIKNYGMIDLNSVTVNWSINGAVQPSVAYASTIPVGGTANTLLGSYTFLSGMAYDVLVWTSMPNGVVDNGTQNDTTSLLGLNTAAAGTFTIGATGDFATIADAATFMTNYGICAACVFNIQSGIYDGQVTLDIGGTSAVNTITFQSMSGNPNDVVIQYAATGSGDNWVFKLNGTDYVTVKDVTIQSTGTGNYGRVIVLDGGADYNTFDGCKIISLENTSSYSSCVYSYSNASDNYNTFSNNELMNGYYCFYLYASSTNTEYGNALINNTMTGYYYYGLYTYYQFEINVDGNYVYQRPSGSSTNYPLYFRYCDGPFRAVNNTVHDDAGSTFYGIYVYYCDATATDPGLVANNMVYTNGNSGTSYGLRMYYSNYVNIYHNSVNIVTGGTTYGAYLYGSSSSGKYDFKNNSIVNMDGGRALYGTSSMLANFTSDHNNLYTTGPSLCYFSGDYPTLTDWQALYPGDVVSMDGSYLSATNLHSNALALDGAATPVPCVSTDIDGDIRDLVTPDIGADEFVLANDDAAITGLPGIYAQCPGVNTIVATVSNYGLIDMSSVIINWEINGVVQTPVNYTTLVPIAGSADVTLGTYTFNAGTLYDITVWSSMPNGNVDPNPGNDTLWVTGISTSISGNYTIGAAGDFTNFFDAIHFIDSTGICGPVVFTVDSGLYAEQVSVPSIMGSSATNTITFQSATGINTDVIVEYAATSSTNNWVFKLNGADYVTVLDMTIRSSGTANYGRVIILEGGA
ncbi:MAG: right-handed parallel beta-helix repeat-containing protein, partial [Bacteroidota bacterium]|nr:right-handed parallel beta-helix repeat-containing protein [Bacteroidota bacterium]